MGKQRSETSGITPYAAIQQNGANSKPSRRTPFQERHLLEFGLKVSERNPENGFVLAVVCRFCVSFGREQKVGAKRKQTANTKYFKWPFRPEQYRTHLESQHASRWASYKDLPSGSQRVYFDDVGSFRTSIHAFVNETQAPIVTLIDRPIVDIIVGQILLDGDEDDSAWIKAKRANLRLHESSSQYVLTINNPVQFHLIVDYLSIGMSFRMAVSALVKTKERTGLASIGSCSPDLPSKYARFVCAMNLQKIKQIISRSWTFSIALDMSTHMSISYLDTRIRIYYGGAIVNLHLLAIPMGESHTGEAMFDAVTPVLDVICPDWRNVMLGITTDGERKMTGVHKGVATRFQNVCSRGFMRVWCGLHQLDLALQRSFKAAMGGRFYGFMTQTTAYLRRQAKLIRQMDAGAATLLQDTRWESMSRCSKWFKTNRVQLSEHLNKQNPACKPPSEWWLVLTLVEKLASRAVITFRSLEGSAALITEQVSEFKRMSSDIQQTFGARVVTDEERRDLRSLSDTHGLGGNNTIVVNPTKLLELLRDDGTFTIGILATLKPDELSHIAMEFAGVIASLVESVNEIEPERGEKNEPLEGQLPPALPRELVKLKGRDLSALIATHRDRMRLHWTEAEMDAIEQEHSSLCEQYRLQKPFRDSIDKVSTERAVTTFENGWKSVDGNFPMLQRFAGGLATTFPGTSTVESDFSLLKWEKPPTKSRLTNFSLEGALHTKQYSLLQGLQVPGNDEAVV